MESFLKEQLKRIQELTERLTSLETHAAELSRERELGRERLSHGPLSDVRDLRTYQPRGETQARSEANDRSARPSSRRRRR